jgi:tetratricopeptide (TPR) repeat protein
MLKDFNKALSLDPNHILTLCARGKYLTKIGRLEEAMKDFDKAYEL